MHSLRILPPIAVLAVGFGLVLTLEHETAVAPDVLPRTPKQEPLDRTEAPVTLEPASATETVARVTATATPLHMGALRSMDGTSASALGGTFHTIDPARADVAVRGVVLDPSGAPMQRVRVFLRDLASPVVPTSSKKGQRTSCVTDARGRFWLTLESASNPLVEIADDRHRPFELALGSLAPGSRVDGLACVLDRGLSIAGRVHFADGRNAARAEVTLELMGAAGAAGRSPQGRTDDRGRFDISGLAPGLYTVRGEARAFVAPALGESSERRHRASVEPIEAGRQDCTIALVHDFQLSGEVVDGWGRPVEDFLLVTRRVGAEPTPGSGCGSTLSFRELDGRFLVRDLEPGSSWSIQARTHDGLESDLHAVEVHRDVEGVRLVARPKPEGETTRVSPQPFGGRKVATSPRRTSR